MKRFIAAVSVVLLLSLAACGGKTGETLPIEETAAAKTASPGPKETDKMSEKTQLDELLDELGYEYRYVDRSLSGEEIVALFENELEKGRAEGYTPVLIPDDESFDRLILKESVELALNDGFDISSELSLPLPDGETVLKERKEQLEGMYGIGLDLMYGGAEYFDPSMMIGENAFPSLEMIKALGGADIALVKLPTKNPWEAVLFIPFGGFNDCPAPREMAAVLKYWYEKYGAVPAVISWSTLDLLLPAPVSSADARTAAYELAAFDYDILGMGTPLSALEASLKASRFWNFWWD